MASRLTFGIDPGISGAIAVLADGEAGPIIDMPLLGEDREVDARQVALFIRAARELHPGAAVSAVIERVRAMPPKDGERRAGAQSSFNFGDHYGKAKAVLELLGIPYTRAEPASWKRQFGLTGQPKDASRVLAIQRFPTVAAQLKRKKDNGRADALLIALYGEQRLASGVAA
jgi:crossover junction endodeoxyribonuclease RuvC